MNETAEDINTRHKRETRSLIADNGGNFWAIPNEIVQVHARRQREEWEEWTDRKNGESAVDPSRRHDKTERLESYVNDSIGQIVTVESLMQASECSKGTAYKFISDNRSTFVKVGRGEFRVVDVDGARAAAKARGRVVAAPALVVAPASEIPDDVRIAREAIDAMTGHAPGGE